MYPALLAQQCPPKGSAPERIERRWPKSPSISATGRKKYQTRRDSKKSLGNSKTVVALLSYTDRFPERLARLGKTLMTIKQHKGTPRPA